MASHNYGQYVMTKRDTDGFGGGPRRYPPLPTAVDDVNYEAESVQFLLPSERTIPESRTELAKDNSKASENDSEEEEPDRMVWGHKIEYLLSMMGYCVGLGNFWRFPYVCIRNGGGAFLIPFFCCLFLCGMPLFFMEVALGQFVSKGALYIWGICPLFKGVGIAMNILCVIISWYYIMILAWTIIYIYNSFKDPLPWTVCGQSWNTENCVSVLEKGASVVNDSLSLLNYTSDESTATNLSSVAALVNGTFDLSNATLTNATGVSSTDEFWRHYVLSLSTGLEDTGGIVWHLLGAMLLSSLIVFLCIMKGVQTVGKVVYVTATLPYIVITVFLIKGLTLPGAVDGISFYVKPDFNKLMLVTTWIEATLQVFYSLGPAWGNLITMASYNKFRNNCMKDALLLSVICEGTSVYAGLATFTILGHLAHRLSVHVSSFSKSGAGLVFVVYPEAMAYLPVPQLWGVLFFFMLFTLGLDSQFVVVETVLTSISDTWPKLMRKREILFKALVLSILCLLSVPFTTTGGMYLFQLADWYVTSVTVTTNALLECFVVGWVYGAHRFFDDISLMIGRRPPFIFAIFWKFITPGFIVFLMIITFIYYKPPVYEGYVYGALGLTIGWSVAFASCLPIPIYAVYRLMLTEGTLMERLKICLSATDDWKPADPKLVEQYRIDNEHMPLFHKPLGCCGV